MSGVYFNHAGVYLIQTLFGLYILAVMLRFLLQTVRADFYNPLVQALVTITNPPLIPLRRLVPGLMGLDMAAIILMLILKSIELVLVFSIVDHAISLPGVLVLALAELFNLFLNVLLFAIIIRVILSWVNPDYRNPIMIILVQLTEPIMRPVRGLLPLLGGIDFSPILIFIGIQLCKLLLVAPLSDLGKSLMV